MQHDKQEKSQICKCGYHTTEFALGLATIDDKIDELRVHDSYKSPLNLIKIHQQVAGHILGHLEGVRDFCGIDTAEEEKRLAKVKEDLSYMNNPEKRLELSNDIYFISDGVRTKLRECTDKK